MHRTYSGVAFGFADWAMLIFVVGRVRFALIGNRSCEARLLQVEMFAKRIDISAAIVFFSREDCHETIHLRMRVVFVLDRLSDDLGTSCLIILPLYSFTVGTGPSFDGLLFTDSRFIVHITS